MLYISIFALDIFNTNAIIMTRTKKTLIAFIFTATLLTVGLTLLEKNIVIFGDMNHESLYYILLGLIIIVSFVYKIRKKDKLLKRADDELSIYKKYKASYYAYSTTLFIWLIVFILQKYFISAQAMLGVGMLLSVIFGITAKIVANIETYEE